MRRRGDGLRRALKTAQARVKGAKAAHGFYDAKIAEARLERAIGFDF